MKKILVTGSSGLVGSEAVEFFCKKKFHVIGIDNNYRKKLFGISGDTRLNCLKLKKKFKNFTHINKDIRKYNDLKNIFKKNKFYAIIHAAAQPSHDWAASKPFVDFSINAVGTLNLLELTRQFNSKSIFVYVSTNKVYGDTPNKIRLIEKELRWEANAGNKYFRGINELMSIDNTLHSLFGVSKCSADLMVQEYAKNFKIKTGIFRAGCITGPNHAGAKLHGFLNYLVKSVIQNKKYTIFGYKGKQVRDNIHSYDLINCFWEFIKKPTPGEVFNIGGGRSNSCSIIEAIKLIEKKTGKKLNYSLSGQNRTGDHIWYITDNSKFQKKYNRWKIKYSLDSIIDQIISSFK
jgi:CDP-paratose 2-epimerase